MATMLICTIDWHGVSAQSESQPIAQNRSLAPQDSTAEPISVETPEITLFGTLQRTRSDGPCPVVLLITGSGGTDRDGNSLALKGPNNSIKMLAEALAARGIASVRYDKRAIGETGKAMIIAAQKKGIVLREEDLRFDSYIDDAVLWGKKLRNDARFSSLTVVGHSEGSLVGMVASQRIGADAYVSIAGSGRPGHVIL